MKNKKVQILRALAIIAVVMIHTCPQGIAQVFIRPFINYAVAIFLFLSGYLTDVSKIEINSFYKKRITKVIIPYIIWGFLYTTFSFFYDGIDMKKYIINYLTGGGASTMYYILVYIQFVILTPFLGKLLSKKYWYIGFFITPISLLFKYYCVINQITPNKYISALWGICCLGWFTFYYLGLYLKNKYQNMNIERDTKNYYIYYFLYAVSIILQIVEGYIWYKLGESNCGTQLKYTSIVSSIIFIVISYKYISNNKFTGNNKILVAIGNYSFGIYICHCMIIKVLNVFPILKTIPYGFNTTIVFIITLLFIMVCKKILGEKNSKYLGFY